MIPRANARNNTTDGGRIVVDAGRQMASSGVYRASGRTGRGGFIDLGAADIRLLSASLEATGGQTGGLVRVGGAFRGGEPPGGNAAGDEALAGRWGELPGMASARQVFVNDGTKIDVSSAKGVGGAAVGWSRGRTTFLGSVDARGLAGGAVALSSAGEVRHGSLSAVEVGGGHLVVAGATVMEGNAQAVQGWSYAGVLGVAQTRAQATVQTGAQTSGGSTNVDLGALERLDRFGAAVSLNGSGTRLAVGAPLDDGAGNGTENAGAVYLFTFTDGAFSGGRLAAVMGKGYTGGRNVDVTALEKDDHFGSSVSLNGAGTRLAVGAPDDDGASNSGGLSPGAVYLFTFTDGAFSGGRLAAVMGKGYTGGRNVNVTSLAQWYGDNFGSSVSLNAAGDRLAVGARGTGRDTGAVYLFTFTDGAFSGGRMEATVGKGYRGGRNIDVAALWEGNNFGTSVSLNGSGTRLAVGAPITRTLSYGSYYTGAVYLFTFTDGAFSGGRLVATVSKGYKFVPNVDVAALRPFDVFGHSVSLDGTGTRLAVGAPGWDSGDRNVLGSRPGAVYLFTFTDDAFSGGRLAAVVGKGYTGGRNIDVAALEDDDFFGGSVSLNAAGTRLAVGAYGDNGAGNGTGEVGAMYLFTFTDGAFSGGRLAAVVGKGYTGDQNVDTGGQDVDTGEGSVDVTALEVWGASGDSVCGFQSKVITHSTAK